MAVELNIGAFKRVPFGGLSGEGDIPVVGVDWSGATFKMEIRANPGDGGSALVSLSNAAAGSQGISATYDAAYAMPDGSGTVGATIIRPQIDEATIEGLSLAARTSDPLTLYYDMHVTPSGSSKRLLCFGTFTIYPGVTI